jgi:hypothetical protein
MGPAFSLREGARKAKNGTRTKDEKAGIKEIFLKLAVTQVANDVKPVEPIFQQED